MRKLLFILFAFTILCSCSSDDSKRVADSQIIVNGSPFEIKLAGIYFSTFNEITTTQFVLDYTEEVCAKCGTAPAYKRIILNIDSTVSENIEGNYDLSQHPQSKFMSGGYYIGNHPPMGFYSGSVTVKKLGSKTYRLDFEAVKGWFWIDHSYPVAISGHFEGDFTSLTTSYDPN